MNANSTRYGRQSIRLKFFDYSQRRSYFLTICANRNKKIVGSVFNSDVILDPAGMVVREVWLRLPLRFPGIAWHEFVVMPNHFHGIEQIVDALPRRGAASSAPTQHSPGLSEIVRAFKSISAIEINRLLGRRGERVWQRNYFEHIIRDENDFLVARKYIHDNPQRWEFDSSEPELRWSGATG